MYILLTIEIIFFFETFGMQSTIWYWNQVKGFNYITVYLLYIFIDCIPSCVHLISTSLELTLPI